MRRRAGFTLVELLVAISILALVAVLGWRGLDGIVRSRVALTAQMDTTRGLQLAFAQLQSDCEHLAPPALLHQRPYLVAENDRLTLIRTVSADNEPTRLQVVAYRVADGVLTRRESTSTRDLVALDALWRVALDDTDNAVPVTLHSGVMGMAIRTWQNGGWQQSVAPTKTPPPGDAGSALILAQAPSGLEVVLQVQGLAAGMTKVFLLGGV